MRLESTARDADARAATHRPVTADPASSAVQLEPPVRSVSKPIVTEQVGMDQVLASHQWLKCEPGAGVAVSVTTLLTMYSCEQSVPQSIPIGELVSVPEPVPAFATLRASDSIARLFRRACAPKLHAS